MKCKKCEKDFDPSYDFIEDYEKSEVLQYFLEEEDGYCSSCLSELHDLLWETATNFLKEVKG